MTFIIALPSLEWFDFEGRLAFNRQLPVSKQFFPVNLNSCLNQLHL
jgi:hypothetical protein